MPLLIIYRDSHVEMSIPDFTTDYGLVERPAVFTVSGTYTFMLYTYYIDSFKTNRSLVTGNARTGEVSYHSMDDMGGIWGSLIRYDKNNPLPSHLAAAVSAYVKLLNSLADSKEVKAAAREMSPPLASKTVAPQDGGGGLNGLHKIGGAVSAPVLIYSVEPQFSEEARRIKFGGGVLVNLWVDTNGLPTHVRVIRGVGHGLDEKAVEAVSQYRFRPAMLDGKPVLVELNVEVNFQAR